MILSLLATTASEVGDKACYIAGSGAVGCGKGLLEPGGFVTTAINTVIFIIGALSVIMIIIGGLRYVLSGGDPAGLKGAKDTILYSIIGLIIALLSFGIVSFIINSVG